MITRARFWGKPTDEQWESVAKRLQRSGKLRELERLQEFRESDCFNQFDLDLFRDNLFMPTPSEIDSACAELRGRRMPDEVDPTATFADVLHQRWGSNWRPVFALSQHNAEQLLGPELCDCPYWGTEFKSEDEWGETPSDSSVTNDDTSRCKSTTAKPT